MHIDRYNDEVFEFYHYSEKRQFGVRYACIYKSDYVFFNFIPKNSPQTSTKAEVLLSLCAHFIAQTFCFECCNKIQHRILV